MTAMESIALFCATAEGLPVAVGGLCLPEAGPELASRLRDAFLQVRLRDAGLYEVDRALAGALAAAGDERLLIAGCSADSGAPLAKGQRTGGILGCPRRAARSSDGEIETLPGGFSLCTHPGGPGLAALAGREETARVFRAVRGLASPSEEAVFALLSAEGIETALLVWDGTGPGTTGAVAAVSPGHLAFLRL